MGQIKISNYTWSLILSKMAEFVKKQTRSVVRTWGIGDCLSVPPIFFGNSYSSEVPSEITKIYGQVKEVFTITCCLGFKWNRKLSMDKVTNEPTSTTKQCIDVNSNHLITSDDYQPTNQCMSLTLSIDEQDILLQLKKEKGSQKKNVSEKNKGSEDKGSDKKGSDK